MLEPRTYRCPSALGRSNRESTTPQWPGSVRHLQRLVLFCLGLALASSISVDPLHAQTNLASITGTISDSTGALVSNSNVTVLNKATSASRTAITGSNGLYSFPSLPLGTYTIRASAPGDRKSVV